MATRTITRYRTRTVRARSRRKAGITVPLAVVAGFTPLAMQVVNGFRNGGIRGAFWELSTKLMMVNPDNGDFVPGAWKVGLGPIALGCLAHWAIGNKLGVNRALGRAGIPFVRF